MAEEIKKNNGFKKAMVLILVALIAAGVIGYFYWNRDRVTTDDAYVTGTIYRITPRVSGYVTEVLVSANQKVKKDEPLLKLDPSEFEVAVAEARAVLGEKLATLKSLELSVPLELNQTAHRVKGAQADHYSLRKTLEMSQKEQEAAVHELSRAEAENAKCLLDLRRMKALIKSKAVSQFALDEAEMKYQTTLAQVQAAKARKERMMEQKASIESDLVRLKANIKLAATGDDQAVIKASHVKAQKAAVELAEARLEQAELDLQHSVLSSPGTGYVTRKLVEPGQMVSKGQPLMNVVSSDPQTITITANLKETQLTHVRPGQPVSIKVDAYPGVTLKGKVESIMAGTGAVFSLFPPENASGNFVKVVQRIPVRIILNEKGRKSMPMLRIGMSVIPTIYTGK